MQRVRWAALLACRAAAARGAAELPIAQLPIAPQQALALRGALAGGLRHVAGTPAPRHQHHQHEHLTEEEHACWSCNQHLKRGGLVCNSCDKIQPVDSSLTYFEILGLPKQTFDLDAAQLERRYKLLQWSLHPDKAVGRQDHEQGFSAEQATLVNRAYSVLKTPLSRANYLVRGGARRARRCWQACCLLMQPPWRPAAPLPAPQQHMHTHPSASMAVAQTAGLLTPAADPCGCCLLPSQLGLKGVEAGEHFEGTISDPELLMEVMEAREKVGGWRGWRMLALPALRHGCVGALAACSTTAARRMQQTHAQ
jgi:hypothetical protein